MQKRTREIIALVMLVVLGIAAVCAMGWYIFVGHNWNEAASNIDDRFGSMEGYTVMLYEGVAKAPRENPGESHEGEAADEAERRTLDQIAESYREKGAQTVILDIGDPRSYAEPIIVSRTGKRIAVFSVEGPRPDLGARIISKELVNNEIDFTIGIVNSSKQLERGLGAANIAICTHWANPDGGGRYVGRVFSVGTPYKGDVEAILLAPSGFVSAKTIKTL